MGKTFSAHKSASGMASVEIAVIIVVLVALVGVSAYVVQNRSVATVTPDTSTSASNAAPAATGTTAAIDQTLQSDIKAESAIDASSDTSTGQQTQSSDTIVANVGGAYDESTL